MLNYRWIFCLRNIQHCVSECLTVKEPKQLFVKASDCGSTQAPSQQLIRLQRGQRNQTITSDIKQSEELEGFETCVKNRWAKKIIINKYWPGEIWSLLPHEHITATVSPKQVSCSKLHHFMTSKELIITLQ